MDLDDIEQLVDLVARSAVSKVTVRWNDKRITVRKRSARLAPDETVPSATQDSAEPEAGVPAEPPAAALSDVHWISAPMVGIFRHAEPPVGPGMRVEQGQVVGAIESIKLLNEVRADVGGIIREVAAEAGMPVEYGQPLFAVAAEEP